MIRYLLRRILYAIPILLGVNLLTFLLFFVVNSPDSVARIHLGGKHVTAAAIQSWEITHGYDKPRFINTKDTGVQMVTDTLFYTKSLKLFAFQFGRSDDGRDILRDIETRMWPSFAIALPTFVLGLGASILVALAMVFLRGTRLDLWVQIAAVAGMSVSGLFYIIFGQYLFAKMLALAPVSGYIARDAWRFVWLPVMIGVVGGLGMSGRWYRALFLDELNRDYVRTARAKGLSQVRVLGRHVLKNAMIPILTGAVVVIPQLFMGSLLMESFFGIPGLGSYTIDAINAQDFAIVQSMVFLGAVLYILGLILTDLSYTLVDPRIRLE